METLRVGTDTIRLAVTSRDTDGALVAAEVRIPAGGGPPVLHRHAPHEVYRVEAGELAVYVEGGDGAVARILATPGDVVHIPSGRAHTVRNESGADAQAYVVFTPGAQIEDFVRAAAGVGGDGPPAMDAVLALAERHGVQITGPLDRAS
jgi:oxalate decarboxylase/phosphoglucose isomerase-like protein (cupin superfamily)